MPFLTFQVGRANSEHVHDVGMPSMLGAYASAHFRDSNETQWGGAGYTEGWCEYWTTLHDWTGRDSQIKIRGAYNITFIIMMTTCVIGLVAVLARTRSKARGGDYKSSKMLILPTYTKIVYALCAADSVAVLLGLIHIKVLNIQDSTVFEDLECVFVGMLWGTLHFVVDGVLVFFCQQSAGQRAINVSMRYATGFAVVSFAMGFFKTWAKIVPSALHEPGVCSESLPCRDLPLIYCGGMMLIYGAVALLPNNLLFRRPAARPYACFWLSTRMLNMLAGILMLGGTDFGFCLDFAVEALIWPLGHMFAVYACLKLDSRFWQGGYGNRRRQRTLSQTLTNFKMSVTGSKEDGSLGQEMTMSSPLVGRMSINMNDASVITKELEGVHDSALLNFGQIWMNKKEVLGAGGTARVYKGTFKGNPAAVKVLYCCEIEHSTVQAFLNEASLLKMIAHKHIVHLHGVCVLPPTLCLVMELCDGGSLDSFVRALCTEWFEGDGAASDKAFSDDVRGQELSRLLEESAAGLAAVHAHSIVHLDVKSPNFLVSKGVVKLADLENSVVTTEGIVEDGGVVPDSLDWTAPELCQIAGGTPSLQSDVYALSVTWWEVVTFCAAAPARRLSKTHAHGDGADAVTPPAAPADEAEPGSVRDKILAAWRPDFGSCDLPQQLRHLIEQGWGDDSGLRPDASVMRDAASAYRMGCMAQLGQAEQDDGFTTVATAAHA